MSQNFVNHTQPDGYCSSPSRFPQRVALLKAVSRQGEPTAGGSNPSSGLTAKIRKEKASVDTYVVYVQDINGHPLMPTKRFGKVKRMLKSGLAKAVQRSPFTIRLLYEPATHEVQDLLLGIDAGREHIGVAVTDSNGTPMYLSQVDTRNKQVAKDMKDRRMYRVARRRYRRLKKKRRAVANQTTYEGKREVLHPGAERPVLVDTCKGKQGRFLNRIRRVGWTTPTVNHLVRTHINIVKKVCSILPIKEIVVEGVRMDFQKIENPDIHGMEYQEGKLKGYGSVEDYIFKTQDGKCIFCDHPIAEYHHIVGRNHNGAESPDNRVGLCKEHHVLVQTDKQWDKALRNIKKGKKKELAAGSIINAATPFILQHLEEMFGKENVHLWYGHDTKSVREMYRVEKDHASDAWCAVIGYYGIEPTVIPILHPWFRYQQYRRHNRAAIAYIHERQYKDPEGKKVATNRSKRMDQKYPSLAEYRQEYGETAVSKLSVKPAGIFYRSGEGWLPGTVVRYDGKARIVRKTTSRGKSVYFEGSEKSVSPKKCTVLLQVGGLMCS